MIKLEARTKLPPKELFERMKRFFGKGGVGLEMTDETPECLYFEGGGGYVNATVCEEKGQTCLDLLTQEWEYQVKKFVSELP
ncbi:MAG: hypothetical protein ACE144_01015 [Thermodesulfobacteriota bacterium]